MAIPTITGNEDTIADYINYLELQDIKLSTVESKIWKLVPFFKFINGKKAEDITKREVESFIISLRKCENKKSTQRNNVIEVRAFMNWLKPTNDFFNNVKIKKEKPDNSKKEYVTSADVAELLTACTNQRDRAFIFLMWESAARLGEVLSLNVGDVKPSKYGITITVTGKTGRCDILLIDAVPDVQLWINQYKGNDIDPLFPRMGKNIKGRLGSRGAQNILAQLVKHSGITKHIYCHSFRHGRLTELSNSGLSEMMLRDYAGWTRGSDMPATYLHPVQKDIEKKLLALKNIVPEEETKLTEVKTTVRKCPRCSTSNPFDAKYCSNCSMVLDIKIALEMEKVNDKLDMEFLQSSTVDPALLKLLAKELKNIMEKGSE